MIERNEKNFGMVRIFVRNHKAADGLHERTAEFYDLASGQREVILQRAHDPKQLSVEIPFPVLQRPTRPSRQSLCHRKQLELQNMVAGLAEMPRKQMHEMVRKHPNFAGYHIRDADFRKAEKMAPRSPGRPRSS